MWCMSFQQINYFTRALKSFFFSLAFFEHFKMYSNNKIYGCTVKTRISQGMFDHRLSVYQLKVYDETSSKRV